MEHQNEMLIALRELTEENRKQQAMLQQQYRTTRLLAILLIVLVAMVGLTMVTFLPKITATLEGFDRILTELNVVVENTKTITQELTAADIEGTIQSLGGTLDAVGSLVEDSSDSLTSAIKKLEALDIETLNSAIQGLYKVVNPLASLFGR